ncbi:hypothetical protein Hamer_G023844 [Homarus americanus]|uniref:Uncharacterized protein n=1 Tax=Homarus americanus TaxID=6706 RepID=A0A8J5TK77_HOMAM|nr:hypothetical protein Hamer_G023844 [Homarus americanus]
METKAMASVLVLMEDSGSLKLEQVLQHRVTEESLSIFNTNGVLQKVQKSKLQEKLTMTPMQGPHTYTSIVDMGLIWRLAAPTTEDREKGGGTKYTWGDYRKKDGFLSTADTSAVEIFYCIGLSAKNHSRGQPAPQFAYSHAEADTAIFFIYSVLRSESYTDAVILDTEDTDNYKQAAYVAHQISGVLYMKRKTQFITSQSLCDEEMAACTVHFISSPAAIITLASMAPARNWWQIASIVFGRHVDLLASHGWHLLDGLCLPVRYTQPPLPTSLSLPLNPDDTDIDTDSESDNGDAADSDSDSNGSSGSSSDSDNDA